MALLCTGPTLPVSSQRSAQREEQVPLATPPLGLLHLRCHEGATSDEGLCTAALGDCGLCRFRHQRESGSEAERRPTRAGSPHPQRSSPVLAPVEFLCTLSTGYTIATAGGCSRQHSDIMVPWFNYVVVFLVLGEMVPRTEPAACSLPPAPQDAPARLPIDNIGAKREVFHIHLPHHPTTATGIESLLQVSALVARCGVAAVSATAS